MLKVYCSIQNTSCVKRSHKGAMCHWDTSEFAAHYMSMILVETTSRHLVRGLCGGKFTSVFHGTPLVSSLSPPLASSPSPPATPPSRSVEPRFRLPHHTRSTRTLDTVGNKIYLLDDFLTGAGCVRSHTLSDRNRAAALSRQSLKLSPTSP